MDDGLGRCLLRLGHATAWLFFAIFSISTLEVALRYLFNAPTNWVHVTSTALAVIAFAAGGSYAMVQGLHLRVTVLVDRATPRWQRAGQWLGVLCGVAYLLGLGWGLWLEARGSLWRFDFSGAWTPERTPGPPNWPLPALAKAALLIGAVLFLLAVLRQGWRLWWGHDERKTSP